MSDTTAEAAAGAVDDVFATDDARVAIEVAGDEARVLHEGRQQPTKPRRPTAC